MDVRMGIREARSRCGIRRLVRMSAQKVEDAMKKTILVVEDNWQDRALLSLMLESAGYPVIHAWNGTEASSVYRRHRSRIAVIVMGDPRVDPHGSFIEFVQQMNPRVPVFAKSAEPWNSADTRLHSPARLKPLSLMIRISRALQRSGGANNEANDCRPHHRFRIEPTAF
jgi:CheY-like chemotaxis protein